jgi:hypothetical protein
VTKVLGRRQLTGDVLATDQAFLECGKSLLPAASEAHANRLPLLRRQAALGGVRLETMPAEMARARLNRSAVSDGTIVWTVELIDLRTNTRTYHQLGEMQSISTVLPSDARDVALHPRGLSTSPIRLHNTSIALRDALRTHTIAEFPTLSHC